MPGIADANLRECLSVCLVDTWSTETIFSEMKFFRVQLSFKPGSAVASATPTGNNNPPPPTHTHAHTDWTQAYFHKIIWAYLNPHSLWNPRKPDLESSGQPGWCQWTAAPATKVQNWSQCFDAKASCCCQCNVWVNIDANDKINNSDANAKNYAFDKVDCLSAGMEGWVRRSQGWSVTPFSSGRSGLSLEFAHGRICGKFQFAIINCDASTEAKYWHRTDLVLQPGGVLCHFHWGDLGRALNFIDDEVNNKDDNSIDVSARRTIKKWTIKKTIVLMPVRKQDEPWRCASLKPAWQTFSAMFIRKIRIEPWIHTRMNVCLNSVSTENSIWTLETRMRLCSFDLVLQDVNFILFTTDF